MAKKAAAVRAPKKSDTKAKRSAPKTKTAIATTLKKPPAKRSSAKQKATVARTKPSAAKTNPANGKTKPAATKALRAAWSVEQTLAELKALGNEKVRAHNAKNGAGENQFGVKHGDLRVVANKIKSDHALALELWKTGNIDAQQLATLIIKPAELSASELERMVSLVSYMWLADWLHSYVVKEHPEKDSLRARWMESKNKMLARAGWRLTAGRMAKNPAGLDPVKLLDRIETEMGHAPAEMQWTMNMCLAEIGIHFPNLRERAIKIGESLGVYRDYPVSKGCTSPFAPIWIHEMVKRRGAGSSKK